MTSNTPARTWSRLVTGDGMRKTRLHSYSGNLVDFAGLRYLPHSLWSALLLKVFGHRKRVPWLGYRAVHRLGSLLKPDHQVLEFGSGMSSLFFARRCARLVSVESDPHWFAQVRGIFGKEGISNVDYRLRSVESYTVLPDLPDHSFDLVIVDGIMRDAEALAAVAKVKSGGYIFFDNSDVPYGEHQRARKTLLDAAEPGSAEIFTDFTPFQFQVNESLLVRVLAV